MAQQPSLHRYAQQIAKRLAKGQGPQVDEDLRYLLEDHPEWLSENLMTLIALNEGGGPGKSAPLVEAYYVLLGMQLEYLRYQVDRGYQAAIGLAELFQRQVVRQAREGRLSHLDLTRIAVLLRDAKLPPTPELFEVASDLLDAYAPQEAGVEEISEFLKHLADESGLDTYEAAQTIIEATYALPPEAVAMLADLMLSGSFGTLAEAVPLMLLDDRYEVRRFITEVLRRNAKHLTPSGLRRCIALRNWLPEAERAPVDQAVKSARRLSIECAPWPEPRDTEIHVSAIDGSGAQGFILLSKVGRKYALSSVLTRHNVGVLDAWSQGGLSKRERDDLLNNVHSQTPVVRASRNYLDLAMQRQLASAQAHGALPPIGLLKIAEDIRATDWQPQRLDLDQAIAELLPALPAEFRTAKAAAGVLKESAQWAFEAGITDSWFEDSQQVADLVRGSRARKRSSLVQQVLKQVIQPQQQAKWAELSLWAARWCREGGPPMNAFWPRFLLLAQALREGHPLKDMPLMAEIADRTVEAALDQF